MVEVPLTAAQASAATGLQVRLDEAVEALPVGERQRLEILKALYRGARILILDEPTAVLVPQEVDELFANLHRLVAQGATIIFISHKLDEVLAVSDDITVIRQGTTVAAVKPAEVNRKRLGELMVGSELPSPSGRESAVGSEVRLAVQGLTITAPNGRNTIDDITFQVHSAEVVGMLMQQRYALAALTAGLHLAGSLILTVAGIQSAMLLIARYAA